MKVSIYEVARFYEAIEYIANYGKTHNVLLKYHPKHLPEIITKVSVDVEKIRRMCNVWSKVEGHRFDLLGMELINEIEKIDKNILSFNSTTHVCIDERNPLAVHVLEVPYKDYIFCPFCGERFHTRSSKVGYGQC